MLSTEEALTRVARLSPYFRLEPAPSDGLVRPTRALREPDTVGAANSLLAARMGTDEVRVACSTLFFGYAARLWSLALGTAVHTGRSLDLDPDELGFTVAPDGGLRLHHAGPRSGRDVVEEVVDRQLEPLVRAWSHLVAPGALWGNAASACTGAGRVLGPRADDLVEAALGHPALRGRHDTTGRRRSCCLYYRVSPGSYCGDCALAPAPAGAAPTNHRSES